jgi:hypothetical protein
VVSDDAIDVIERLRGRGATLIRIGKDDIEVHFPPQPPLDTAEILRSLRPPERDEDPEQPRKRRSQPDVLSDPELGLPSLPDYGPITDET